MDSLDTFTRLLSFVREGVMTTDAEGKILFLNPAAEELLGVAGDEAVGRPQEEIFQFVRADGEIPIPSPILRTLQLGAAVELAPEIDLLSKNSAKRFPVSGRTEPNLGADGKLIGSFLLFRETTAEERRRREIGAEMTHWDALSTMVQIYHFRFNFKTREIEGSDQLKKIWPIHDGRAVSGEAWLAPEELPHWKNAFEELISGRQVSTITQYRTTSGGSVRHFRVFMRRVSEHSDVIFGLVQEVTELQELSEIRQIISTAFELLFPADDLTSGIRALLKRTCEFIGFSRAYISYVDEAAETVELYLSYLPDGETPLFDNRVFSLHDAQSLDWFKMMNESKPGDVFDCDFSKEEDRRKAERHTPYVLERYREFDIRGIHVNYIVQKNKLRGSVGFITQHRPMKKLSKNEQRLLQMVSHIIALALYRKQIIEKLNAAVQEAQDANRAKSFFLASMSHEIRTPLNAVIGFADLLKDAELDQTTQHEYLSGISFAGNALLQLVNDILDLSKLEAGQVEFVPEKTNLSEFCREISAVFCHSANQKNIKLEFAADNIPDLFIDRQRIRQILFNLIGNSIKFTPSGGIKVTLNFMKTAAAEGTLTIRVSDTGIGVAPEDLNRLFEPFVQLTRMRGTNAANNGTGLGLPIVKKMITQMGGEITLESEPGKGSTFKLILPHVKFEPLEAPKIDDDLSPPFEGLCPQDKTPRVLLVDETPLNLRVLISMLKRLKVEYQTASSGESALELLRHGHFNIVLTGLSMPDMSGEELARRIRSDPLFAEIRTAAVAAKNNQTAFNPALFDSVMRKPISLNTLYTSIFGR